MIFIPKNSETVGISICFYFLSAKIDNVFLILYEISTQKYKNRLKPMKI